MTKGIKLGSWVAVSYRVPIKQEIDENDTGHYEGKIVDKRIGGQDRESFIELKDVLKVDIDGNVIGKEKHKRLIDAFIEECKVIEKRDQSWDEIKLQSQVEAETLAAMFRQRRGRRWNGHDARHDDDAEHDARHDGCEHDAECHDGQHGQHGLWR